MHPFRYTRVPDVATAIAAVAPDEQAMYIAGGTSLLDLMKLSVQTPEHLVDISALPLSGIDVHDNGARIGALARNSDMAFDDRLRARYPVLVEALLSGASPQLRNMATVSGNLLQRTRCYYFRDPAMSCNKREPGSGCSAIDGYNRQHAILGSSPHCITTHPSDLAVALVVLDAVVLTSGPAGERRIPLTDFYLLPETHPERETALEHGELITAIEIPASPFAVRSCYVKVRDRASYAFALVSVAAALDIQQGRIRAARIALGGVAPIPWRAYYAESALAGQRPEKARFEEAATMALIGAKAQRHNAFKIELTRRTIVRALTQLEGMEA